MTKAPSCGDVVFAGDVGDAEQQRGDERAGDARRAADRHDDQEVDHELERKVRIEAEDLGAERAAEAGEARADREGDGEHRIDVDAEAARHARVVDRRAQAAAEARAREHELQREGEEPAHHDDEQPVASDADADQR